MTLGAVGLALGEGAILGLAALAVKTQLSVNRGFDLAVAASVILGAESAIAMSKVIGPGTIGSLIGSGMVALAVSTCFMLGWNGGLASLLRTDVTPGAFLFVFSLGIATLASGLIGFLRGPGLRQAEFPAFVREADLLGLSGSPLVAVIGGTGLLVLMLLGLSRRSGMAIDLLAQDREFALELGIEPRRTALAAGIVTGVAAGFLGWYLAHSTGSTPEIGLQVFLLGAGGALLLPGRGLLRAIQGGFLLGLLHVFLQLHMAPAVSLAILFTLVFALVWWRGTSRTIQGVR